jgi:hypothetical protein
VISAWAGSPLYIPYRSATVPINNYVFHLPGFKGKIKVFEGVKNANYEFAGDFEKGLCAVRLLSARKENTGVATIEVTFKNMADDLETKTAYINLNVSYLQLTPTSENDVHQFKEHQQMEFNCTAHGLNPTPILEFLHGTKSIKSH